MNVDFIPEQFSRFLLPIKAIVEAQPVAVSIVGSYGNPNKRPTEKSDLDLIFVFDVDSIFNTYQDILDKLRKCEDLEIVELGVHFQYGFVLSIYHKDKPLSWIDVGIMDVIFSSNYLVNLPRKDVFGTIHVSGIKQNPLHQLNHLARKILKLRVEGDGLSVDAACYRYLDWLKVYSEIQEWKVGPTEETSSIVDLYKPDSHVTVKEVVVNLVLNDISTRFKNLIEKNDA